MKKTLIILIIIVVISIPTFFRMLRPGIYSMQDFHFFRLVEFDSCIRDFQIPCRWSANAGYGYGEPLFNFYGQLPYAIGEIFHLIGIPFTDSLKFVFILSVVGSGIAMFFLSRQIWGNNYAGVISAVLYMYAPYRAVDVWVRGALPESLSFAIFPLIILYIEKYFDKEKLRDLILVSMFGAALVLNHNLSLFMFLPFVASWCIYRLVVSKKYYLLHKFMFAILLTALISSFYLLPVIAESKFIDLGSTIQGYFDYRAHFIGLKQIFLSNYWGYGGSTFGPEDGLNLSVGYLQWIIPAIAGILILLKKTAVKSKFLLLGLLGIFFLFLTHNKSNTLWNLFPLMAYIQFPWRFLGLAIFSLSLASGTLSILTKRQVMITLIVSIFAVGATAPFFREDIWYLYKDNDLLSGKLWEDQTAASRGDYWPGLDVPNYPAPRDISGMKLIEESSNKIVYETSFEKETKASLPHAYFPGWQGNVELSGQKSGLMEVIVPNGHQTLTLVFKNTPVRTVGNLLSVAGITLAILLLIRQSRLNRKKEMINEH